MLKRWSAAKRRRLSREESVCSSSTSMTVNKITADIINNDYTGDIKEFNACHRVSNICRDTSLCSGYFIRPFMLTNVDQLMRFMFNEHLAS